MMGAVSANGGPLVPSHCYHIMPLAAMNYSTALSLETTRAFISIPWRQNVQA